MLIHFAEWPQFRGPLIAFGAALGLVVAGRILRVGWLAAAACGVGVVAGWYVITGRLWVVLPAPSVEDLTELSAVALLIGLLANWLGAGRLAWIGVPLSALAAGWILAGAPRHQAAWRANWAIFVAVGLAVFVFARALTDRTLDPVRPALAALTLAAALHVAGAPAIWLHLALVPGLASLAMFAVPALSGRVALPVAVDIAALGCLTVLLIGRLARLGFASPDAAALSPLLAIWLHPRIGARLPWSGGAAPLAGGALAGGIAVGCVWLVRQLLR
jgi:hypothetical protein